MKDIRIKSNKINSCYETDIIIALPYKVNCTVRNKKKGIGLLINK